MLKTRKPPKRLVNCKISEKFGNWNLRRWDRTRTRRVEQKIKHAYPAKQWMCSKQWFWTLTFKLNPMSGDPSGATLWFSTEITTRYCVLFQAIQAEPPFDFRLKLPHDSCEFDVSLMWVWCEFDVSLMWVWCESDFVSLSLRNARFLEWTMRSIGFFREGRSGTIW